MGSGANGDAYTHHSHGDAHRHAGGNHLPGYTDAEYLDARGGLHDNTGYSQARVHAEPKFTPSYQVRLAAAIL
jgi:hypothetical protein